MDAASILVPALALTAFVAFVSLFLRLARSRKSLSELQTQIRSLREETCSLSDEKASLDRQMAETRMELNRLRGQLESASTAMAAREEELDDTRERAREAGRTKSLFVANMSHELRTPLNGILGLTRNLLDSTLTPQQRSEAELIQVAGEDLVRIVNDVLDLSKLEAGKLSLEKVPFDFCDVLEGAFSLLYPQAERKHLAYGVTYSHRLRRKFVGDPFRLRQVTLNLLSNAIKFTPSGTVLLHAAEGEPRGGSVWMRLLVEDTGIGIEPEKLRVIFDEFQQADLSTTRKYGGTGLGLSLSKRIVDLMGGEISVESEPGQGSRFMVHIPLTLIRTPEEYPSGSSEAISLEGLRILVQDRHCNQFHVLMRILEALPGLSIGRFSTGADVVTQIQQAVSSGKPIDAVITAEESSSLSPDVAQQALRKSTVNPPLHIILSDHAAGNHAAMLNYGRTVILYAPLLPSRVVAMLQQLRDAPVGPLFESAGLTAFDVYRDFPALGSRKPLVIVAHDNAVELRLLEVLLQKLERDFVSVNGEGELLARLREGEYGALLVHGRMLQEPVVNALLSPEGASRDRLRLAVVGDTDDAALHRLSERCASFAHFAAAPRLSQLREFFRV